MSMYQEHRQRFLEVLFREQMAAVIPTETEKTRNHDAHYRFRPHSDFWYLTGFAEPESVLVLVPGKEKAEDGQAILFLRERNKEMEIWDGKRLGVDDAPEMLGLDEAHPIEDLWKELPNLLAGQQRIVYRSGHDEDFDWHFHRMVEGLRGRARRGIEPPTAVLDPGPYLHELRLHKSPGELECMRHAARITTQAHCAAMAAARPGVYEYEIDALLEYTFRRHGSTGPAYNSIVAGGANACILHYIENDQRLCEGELLLIDAGAEWKYYASDVTRTFPVSGTFSEPQKALYEVVLRAQLAAIDVIRPGVATKLVHETALHALVDGLIELGLCQGTREEVIESNAHRDFFMHGTSHWLGLDVHDQGAYTRGGESRPLAPGMVLTVEPG
ncbi:MAG TPA: aminopeptidase P N-terminal domain-containing protein, partial [Planctomycetota bacterium]|nr:aminopeptidase P N-terminal domain-containing protein [Planctomycetota bacterium]